MPVCRWPMPPRTTARPWRRRPLPRPLSSMAVVAKITAKAWPAAVHAPRRRDAPGARGSGNARPWLWMPRRRWQARQRPHPAPMVLMCQAAARPRHAPGGAPASSVCSLLPRGPDWRPSRPAHLHPWSTGASGARRAAHAWPWAGAPQARTPSRRRMWSSSAGAQPSARRSVTPLLMSFPAIPAPGRPRRPASGARPLAGVWMHRAGPGRH